MSLVSNTTNMAAPLAAQISVPFQITNGGAVAFQTGLVQIAAQALLGVILTSPGERVMRPTFGSEADSYVFSSNSPQAQAALISDIKSVVGSLIPNLAIRSFEVSNPTGSSVLLNIVYQVLPGQTTYTAQISTGPIIENVSSV